MRKREGKNRLLLCFRPLVLEDDSRPTTKFKFPAHSGDDHFSQDGNVSEIVKEKQSHRSVKSVMSDIFMTTKKIGSRRFRSQSLRTSCIDSSTTAASAAEENKLLSKTMSDRVPLRRSSSIDTDEMSIFKSDSSRRCSTTTTTTASSSLNSSSGSSFSSRRNGTCWQSNSNELKQVDQQHKMMMTTNNDQFLKTSVGLSLIVLSLLVLIVWGKICAILCTSTWLVFMPGRFKEEEEVDDFQILNQKSNGDEEEVELFDSGVYKKRVIMEGLLDRNRTTRRL